MWSDESPRELLRRALIGLSDSGFERYIAAALSEVTGRTFHVADSGRQDGGDGGAHDALSTVFECKRYDKGAPPLDSLLGKFVLAGQRSPPPDLWILAATRPISEQRVRTLQREADNRGIGLLILDMPRDQLGNLAVLSAAAPASSSRLLPGAVSALHEIQNEAGFAVAAERLRSDLNGADLTFHGLRSRTGAWLAEAYADPELLFPRLAVRPPPGITLGGWAGYVERAELRVAIESWLRGKARSGQVLCVVGEEGVGKSLSCHRVLADQLEKNLVIVVSRSIELTTDPFDLMAMALRQALGGEVGRWRRKLEILITRADVGYPPVILYLDGVDERAGGAWDTLLRRLSDRPFLGRVAVMLSCRPYSLQEHLRDLAFLGGCEKAPVGIFNDAELQDALSARGLRAETFLPDMRDLMRRPRLLGLALQHRARLEAAGEFTPARLFWEDWDDRIAAGREIASRPRYRAGLRRLATSLDAERLAVSSLALLEAFSPPLGPLTAAPYATLSELVDGGLARLDLDRAVLDPGFAAFALGHDLAQRLASIEGTPENLADRVRTWLEPWGGAEFEAEVMRAAAWSSAVEEKAKDTTIAALVSVWLERKNLPDSHEADVLAVCRRHPAAIADAANVVWRGEDHAACDRVQAVLQRHAADPAIRVRLIQDARRWISQVGLLSWPSLRASEDPAEYRTRRIAEVVKLVGGEFALDCEIEIDGERITVHEGAGGDGEDAFRRTVTVLRPGGEEDLWPLIRAWAVATEFRDYEHLAECVAGVMRACEAGSPLHCKAHHQLSLWSASDAPALLAAARALSWVLGEPEARRTAESALVRSGFVASREEQLRQIGLFGDLDTIEGVREGLRHHNPDHSLRRFGRWLTDPEVQIPQVVVSDTIRNLAKLDQEELLRSRSTTRSSLQLDEITAVLARDAPHVLGDWYRSFARVVAAQSDDDVVLARRRVHNAFVVLDQETVRVLTLAKGEDRAARDLRMAAELALRDGDAQIEHLLTAPLPAPISANIDEELRSPTTIGLLRVVESLASARLEQSRLIALMYALVSTRPEENPELSAHLMELLAHPSSVVRAYSMQLLRQWQPKEAAARLRDRGWTVEGAEDDYEAHWGSLLIACGGEPVPWAIGTVHPAHAVQVAERHPEAATLVAGLLAERLSRLGRDCGAPTPEHIVTMTEGDEPDGRSVLTGKLLDEAATDMADRFSLFFSDHERREEIVRKAIEQVFAHDEALRKLSGRRPDWRVETEVVVGLWRAEPSAFLVLGDFLEGLHGDHLDEAAYREPGILFSLVEAGLKIDPHRFAPVWRRLRHQEFHRQYRTQLEADWLQIMPFRLEPQRAPPELLEEALDTSQNDAQLFDVAIYASAQGHDSWLTSRIDRDISSGTAWRRARALMLEGFLGRSGRRLDPYPRLDPRASWLSDVGFKADNWRRRRKTLDYWFDRFVAAEDPDEIFATFELVKRNATRLLRLRIARAQLGDSQRRHLMRDEYELKRKIEDGDKELGSAYLGLKLQSNIWPPWSPARPATR